LIPSADEQLHEALKSAARESVKATGAFQECRKIHSLAECMPLVDDIRKTSIVMDCAFRDYARDAQRREDYLKWKSEAEAVLSRATPPSTLEGNRCPV
jgi:hypothetical protein